MLEAVEAPAEARQDPSQALRASLGFPGPKGPRGPKGPGKFRNTNIWGANRQLVAQPVSELVRPTSNLLPQHQVKLVSLLSLLVYI